MATVKTGQEEWDARFARLAAEVAAWSKDPERKVGAVIVSADRQHVQLGYNGFPSDIPDEEEYLQDRTFKLNVMVHAEENALRKVIFPIKGCTLYVTAPPCLRCAGIVIDRTGEPRQAGHLVCPPLDPQSSWHRSHLAALEALQTWGWRVHHMEFPTCAS